MMLSLRGLKKNGTDVHESIKQDSELKLDFKYFDFAQDSDYMFMETFTSHINIRCRSIV